MKFKKATRLSIVISIALIFTLCFGAVAVGACVIPSKTNESKPVVNSQAAISDIKINVQNCNVIILPSDDTNFKYEYDKELFQVSEQIENHSMEITANPLAETLVPFNFSKDTRIRIYLPDQAFDIIDIVGEDAGISVLPFNSNIELTNNNGASSVYLDKHFNKELHFVIANGSGSINLQDEFNDYSLTASVMNSSFLPAEDMPVFPNDSLPYTLTSGKGTASLKLDVQNSSFAIYKYSGEAANLLEKHFDIVSKPSGKSRN